MIRTKMDQENRAKQFTPFDALSGYSDALKEKEAPSVNMNEQVIVPVIASFNKSGDMLPIYFSAEGIRLKIDHVKWSEQKKWGTIYRCEITVQDRVETVDLYYYATTRLWSLRM